MNGTSSSQQEIGYFLLYVNFDQSDGLQEVFHFLINLSIVSEHNPLSLVFKGQSCSCSNTMHGAYAQLQVVNRNERRG